MHTMPRQAAETHSTIARSERLLERRDHALAELADRKRELAAMGDEPERPTPPLVLAAIGCFGVAATLMPSFHDLLFAALLPTPAALAAGFAFGLCLAAPMIVSVLTLASYASHSEGHGRLGGMALAAAFAAGLLLVRLTTVEAPQQALLAFGFTLFEIAILGAVERAASAYARRVAETGLEGAAFAAANAQVRAAEEILALHEADARAVSDQQHSRRLPQ